MEKRNQKIENIRKSREVMMEKTKKGTFTGEL
jgi:hypothetical protein